MYVTYMYNVDMYIPALERTFSDDNNKKKVRRRKLDELENLAPSPLIFTMILSTLPTSVTCITKTLTSNKIHDIVFFPYHLLHNR